MTSRQTSAQNGLILIFATAKILLNLCAMPHFGFHRDELLHLALADHLDWGYKEVPPLIAIIAYLSIHLFGASVFAARVFSTCCGAFIIWLAGKITVELGGSKFAVAITCLSLIAAPAFLASDYLFQPVVFDQLWWVLSAWLAVKYVNTRQRSYLYWFGAAIGLGLLTKYSMAFFAFALLLGLLISSQRRLLFNKNLAIAALIAFLVFLPNIIWQFIHHFPFVTHMRNLKAEQLNYNKPADFIIHQLLANGAAVFIWLTGLLWLLFSKQPRQYRFLGFAYLLVFLFLLKMNGKAYYLFGAYPMLFAAGGLAIERLIAKKRLAVRSFVLGLATLPNLLLLPLLLPVLPIGPTLAWFRWVAPLHIFDFAVTWEDHKKHPLTQDYADMFGWDEMAQKAAQAYHSLTPEQQKETIIFAGNYGEAGALHHYAKQHNVPDVISLNSSFALWAPVALHCKYMIYVDEDAAELITYFEHAQPIGVVNNPLAREKGTGIYLYTDPKPQLLERYRQEWLKKSHE